LLAEDPTIISWDRLGRITISDPAKLSSEVLINYFRHSNFSSFQRQLNYFGYYKISGKGKLERCVYTNNALRNEGGGRPGIEAPPYATDALLRLKRKSSRDGAAAAAASAAEKEKARAARPGTARQSSRAQKSAALATTTPAMPVEAADPRAAKRQRSDTEGTIVTVATAESCEDSGDRDDIDDHPDISLNPGCWVEDIFLNDFFGDQHDGGLLGTSDEESWDGLGRTRLLTPTSPLQQQDNLAARDGICRSDPNCGQFLGAPPPNLPHGCFMSPASGRPLDWPEHPIVQTRSELWIGPGPLGGVTRPF